MNSVLSRFGSFKQLNNNFLFRISTQKFTSWLKKNQPLEWDRHYSGARHPQPSWTKFGTFVMVWLFLCSLPWPYWEPYPGETITRRKDTHPTAATQLPSTPSA